MDSDLLFGMVLLFLAIWLAYRGLRSLGRRTRNRKQDSSPTLQEKLPAIGTAGTVDRNQRRVLRRLAVPEIDIKSLSREQGEILLDSVAYVQSVWESELDRRMTDLSPDLLTQALRIILDHESYRERVVSWHQGLDVEDDIIVPDDACHVAVRHHLAQMA
jgi:hypothetical protein